MPITVESRLHPSFGVSIKGFDASRPFEGEDLATMRRLLDEHLLVLVRGGKLLAPPEQIRLMSAFGKVVTLWADMAGHPGLFRTVNTPEKAEGGVVNAGTQGWHNDGLYRDTPTELVSYHIIEVASRGGDTLFASGPAAFESLSPELRARLENARAIHGRLKSPAAVHRVVRTHPRTGRQALFLAPLAEGDQPGTIIVLGMSKSETADLIAMIDKQLDRDDVMYRHKWQPNDLLISDNYSLLHRAEMSDPTSPRVLHRVSTEGALDYDAQQSFEHH